MASFEPVIILHGSVERIASCQLRFPISFLTAFDEKTLINLVNIQPQLNDIVINRYFIILLDTIENQINDELTKNHRVISIYHSDRFCSNDQNQINQMRNSYKQLSLDVTNDIIHFLTLEGNKQLKLERTSLVSIYYKQARILKEWAMTSFRAEPCHILLVSLNSSQDKLDEFQRRLEKDLHYRLGGDSTLKIRQLNDYIPQSDRYSSILPYAKQLFEYEKPSYLVRLLRTLSPIRLYVYGNELKPLKEWNQLMIESEQSLMTDEDNWCAFLQSEPISDDVKWNFAPVYAKTWKLDRISPFDYDQFIIDPRFHSAICRAHRTFAERQMEVTSQIFDWYDNCVKNNYLSVSPQLDRNSLPEKFDQNKNNNSSRFRHLRFLNYSHLDQIKNRSIAFIWLDEYLIDCPTNLHQAIQPFRWKFFFDVTSVVSFIENQLRERQYIFLVCSGKLGSQLFSMPFSLKYQIYAAYVYCGQLNANSFWASTHSNIRGVFNESIALAQRIHIDCEELRNQWKNSSITLNNNGMMTDESTSSLPLPIFQADSSIQRFVGHQRTIDNLLCMPHDEQSKMEMIKEFRRFYPNDESTSKEIDVFEATYQSNGAVRWYTRDAFVWRALNQVLRSSDADAMFRFRHILIDIYAHLDESRYQRYTSWNRDGNHTFYRGQIMKKDEFENFRNLRGSIISINTFLSTTSSMQVALLYAGKYFDADQTVSVVFQIETNVCLKTRPFANISAFSLFPDEDETLFGMGCLFSVGNIRLLPDSDTIHIIHLKMLDSNALYERL